MSGDNITPKNGLGKQKEGEIFRLQVFMAFKNLKPEDIQRDTGISARTITHSLYEEKPLGAKLLRELHSFYGVSIDWLVSGIGQMLITKNAVNEQQGEYSADIDRVNSLARAIDLWMSVATEAEKTWLETDIKITLSRNWPPVIRNK